MKNGHFTLNKSHFSQWQLDRLDQPNQTSHNHYLNIFEVPPPKVFCFLLTISKRLERASIVLFLQESEYPKQTRK